jgi:chromosome segregation ATPase
MARQGVTFANVEKAAAALLLTGQPVTIDNVRTQLGDTGSRSTIAPLLKRWKDEQSDLLDTSLLTSLPRDLLYSVQRVHDEIQQRFKTELAAAEIASTLKCNQVEDENKALRNQLSESESTLDRLRTNLDNANARLVDIEVELTAMNAQQAKREAAYEVQQQLVLERTNEVMNLREQLTHARHQFNHFQEANQKRWDQERLLQESKLSSAMKSTEELRVKLQQSEAFLNATQGQLTQLTAARNDLNQKYEDVLTTVEEFRDKAVQQKELVKRLGSDAEDSKQKLAEVTRARDLAVEDLVQTSTKHAIVVGRAEILEARLNDAEQRLDASRSEYMELMRNHIKLESDLNHYRGGLKDDPESN